MDHCADGAQQSLFVGTQLWQQGSVVRNGVSELEISTPQWL
jgi:hypothetical protein